MISVTLHVASFSALPDIAVLQTVNSAYITTQFLKIIPYTWSYIQVMKVHNFMIFIALLLLRILRKREPSKQ